MGRSLRCLLAVALFLPAALGAADPLPDPDAGAAEWELWQQSLREARGAVAEARSRQQAAEIAYTRMRHHNRGRGAAKEAILVEREEARRELAEAGQRLEELAEQARRAGVPPGWLEPDEDEAMEEPAARAP